MAEFGDLPGALLVRFSRGGDFAVFTDDFNLDAGQGGPFHVVHHAADGTHRLARDAGQLCRTALGEGKGHFDDNRAVFLLGQFRIVLIAQIGAGRQANFRQIAAGKQALNAEAAGLGHLAFNRLSSMAEGDFGAVDVLEGDHGAAGIGHLNHVLAGLRRFDRHAPLHVAALDDFVAVDGRHRHILRQMQRDHIFPLAEVANKNMAVDLQRALGDNRAGGILQRAGNRRLIAFQRQHDAAGDGLRGGNFGRFGCSGGCFRRSRGCRGGFSRRKSCRGRRSRHRRGGLRHFGNDSGRFHIGIHHQRRDIQPPRRDRDRIAIGIQGQFRRISTRHGCNADTALARQSNGVIALRRDLQAAYINLRLIHVKGSGNRDGFLCSVRRRINAGQRHLEQRFLRQGHRSQGENQHQGEHSGKELFAKHRHRVMPPAPSAEIADSIT